LRSDIIPQTKIKNIGKEWKKKNWIRPDGADGVFRYVGGNGAPIPMTTDNGEQPAKEKIGKEELKEALEKFSGTWQDVLELVSQVYTRREESQA
jgi:hypothetical protein